MPAIEQAVEQWRKGGWKGVTETSRTLLNYWFNSDHRLPNGRKFEYHYAQRSSVETMVYLYKVAKVRSHKELVEKFATNIPNLRLLQYDDFPRYCIKMATGSGKTKVMSLAIAWQYFNAAVEDPKDFASSFLIIAPNVIVFERLQLDFAGGRIFQADPVIPPELKVFWDVDFYMRGEGERASSTGAVYLTNIQQFYERGQSDEDEEPEEMTAVLGPKPKAQTTNDIEDFDKRIAERGGRCLVLNDEAHHTHEEESEWNRFIRRLHADVPGGLAGQLDFTATPRYHEGSLFTWTVFDYPLKQAILDHIVKSPMKGIVSGMQEQPSELASVRYQAYLTAGVERWREYRDALVPLKRKPVLFVMMNSTADAEDVGEYLRSKYPSEFGGEDKLLVIHTDRKGEISKKDLDKARKASREVDDTDSPINAIVSVLMLREGWDVQSVTVIVGLRPYTSAANILPEQTVGRGLRLMFRDLNPTYQERVDVIGNSGFMKFVDDLGKDEDIAFQTFDPTKDKVVIVTIFPDAEKAGVDIAIPVLSPILARKKTLSEEIEGLDIASTTFNCPVLPKKKDDAAASTFRYEGKDLITLETLIQHEYTIPQAQTSQEVISYYARRIAREVKLPSQFAALAPKVRAFLETRAFGEKVSLDSKAMIQAISSNVAQYVTVKTFVAALRNLVVEELSPQLVNEGRRLSETPGFPWSRPTFRASKSVFNLVPCDNEFERRFAKFLEEAPDIRAFAKLPTQFGFTIEYTDSASNLRYYEPDFVAELLDGNRYLVETKGLEDVNVAHKDRAARIWCENATLLAGEPWQYLKVPQSEFTKLEPGEFADLAVVLSSPTLF